MMLPAALMWTVFTGLGTPIPGINGVILGVILVVTVAGGCKEVLVSSLFSGAVSSFNFVGAGSGKITGTP